jgi:ribosome-associated translation inhibitor RaiA
MKYSNQRHHLRIQLDAQQCDLSAAVITKMETSMNALRKQVEDFPVSDLHILVGRNGRSNDYSVKTSLVLPGGTLVSSEHSPQIHPAFEKCVHNLLEEVRAYKERMGLVAERQKQEKGTRQEVAPTLDPDLAALEAAVRDGDYAAFRAAAFGYEEPLRKRIGRWVERYPELDAQIDRRLKIADIVEEVFLDAFEGYAKRPREVRFGDWLAHLIDPAIKALAAHTDEELENINLARSARAAEQGPEAV